MVKATFQAVKTDNKRPGKVLVGESRVLVLTDLPQVLAKDGLLSHWASQIHYLFVLDMFITVKRRIELSIRNETCLDWQKPPPTHRFWLNQSGL